MYDVAIIGLGPAGATLARLLPAELSVVALDKKGEADLFRKPCGGLLAMDAQKALSKFNLTLPKDVLVDPQIFSVKTADTQQNLLRHYQRFYINLDRHKFDLWLISLIPPQVEVISDSHCTTAERIEGGFRVSYVTDGQKKTLEARFLVGADGSNSIVRRALFPRRSIRQYLSIQEWFPEEHANAFYSCVFDRRITDSYCWSISKDGCFILGGAFPIKTGKERFERLKQILWERGFSFGEPIRREACLVSIPTGLRSFCVGRDGAFLIGEAAGFISPSSLEGISYAIDSGHLLAQVLRSRPKNPGRLFRVRSIPIRVKLLAKWIKSQFMYRPFLRKCVMRSGLLSIEMAQEGAGSGWPRPKNGQDAHG